MMQDSMMIIETKYLLKLRKEIDALKLSLINERAYRKQCSLNNDKLRKKVRELKSKIRNEVLK